MPLYYIEFVRDPTGAYPEHLCPSAGEGAFNALNELHDQFEPQLRVVVPPVGQLDAYAVVRYPDKIGTLTVKAHWRDSLREASLAVTFIERVYEPAEVRGPGKFWQLADRGPSGWLLVSIEDGALHGSPQGELVVVPSDRQKPAQRLLDLTTYFRPKAD